MNLLDEVARSDSSHLVLCCIHHVSQVTCSRLDSDLCVVYADARQSAIQSQSDKEMSTMGMRAVFATVEAKKDHEQGMILNHTTVQWASYIPGNLAYAMAADEDNQQNKVIGLFYHACRMYDHISCIDNQIVKNRVNDVKEMSIPAGSDDKGREIRLSVTGGQKLGLAESRARYTSSVDLAKVFVEGMERELSDYIFWADLNP